MDRTAIANRLRALATSEAKRSKASRLRDVLEDVEAALAAGAKRADVLAALETHGLSMSLSTFETTLKRLRAKRGRMQTSANAVQASVRMPSLLAPASGLIATKVGIEPSHDPADLDRIITAQPDLIALAKLGKRKKK